MYTISLVDGPLWLFTYIFTPIGHEDIRERLNNPSIQRQTKGFLKEFYVPNADEDESELFDVLDEAVDTAVNEDIVANNLPIENAAEPFSQTDLENLVARNKRDLPLLDAFNSSDTRPPIAKLEDIFLQLLPRTKCDPNNTSMYLDYFRKYLASDYRRVDLSPLDCKRFNWVTLRAKGEEKWPLADLAMRIEPNPCAEASCERVISVQRLLLTSKRMRTNPDLLDARLILKSLI
jgi:hypothetical protein